MYRNTKFLEVLHKIRQEMSEEFDFDVMRLVKSLQNPETRQSPLSELPTDEERKNSEPILTANYGNRF